MIISLNVKPQSRKNEVIKINDNEYIVKTTAPAQKGKANEAVKKLLTDYFKIKKSQINLVRGLQSRSKTVLITV